MDTSKSNIDQASKRGETAAVKSSSDTEGGKDGETKQQNSVTGKITARKGVAEKVGPAKKNKKAKGATGGMGKTSKEVSAADEAGRSGLATDRGATEASQGAGDADGVAGGTQEVETEPEDGRRRSSAKMRGWNNPFIAK